MRRPGGVGGGFGDCSALFSVYDVALTFEYIWIGLGIECPERVIVSV